MSNVLDLVDQTAFLGERATKATNLLQVVWVYNGAIDIDGLRDFHRHLQQGRLSRRIERSPLPFGRHRWVSPSDQPNSRSRRPARVENPTPGSTSRPTRHWIPSTDPDGTSRYCRSPTVAPG